MVRRVLALDCAVLVATGCGNIITTDMIGATGIAVSEQCGPEAVIVVCRESTNRIDLFGDRTGLSPDETNP